ncbi:hypothetical protein JCM10550A_11270 [Methanogenium cariaci]|jgi:hypothetical protein
MEIPVLSPNVSEDPLQIISETKRCAYPGIDELIKKVTLEATHFTLGKYPSSLEVNPLIQHYTPATYHHYWLRKKFRKPILKNPRTHSRNTVHPCPKKRITHDIHRSRL